MPTPLLRSFERFEDACAARDALLAAGLPDAAVQLRVAEDEAGPVEGNFLVGNGRTEHGGPPAAVRAGPEAPYEANFARVVARGAHLLVVEAADALQQRSAQEVLSRFNGLDVSAASARGG